MLVPDFSARHAKDSEHERPLISHSMPQLCLETVVGNSTMVLLARMTEIRASLCYSLYTSYLYLEPG